uniref:Uncharacterized protein n=1 Tax=Polynucleobacter necessarius subsp. necessarius (strain STIR1) TaxID=452638 RepID=B1XU21_POLNS
MDRLFDTIGLEIILVLNIRSREKKKRQNESLVD